MIALDFLPGKKVEVDVFPVGNSLFLCGVDFSPLPHSPVPFLASWCPSCHAVHSALCPCVFSSVEATSQPLSSHPRSSSFTLGRAGSFQHRAAGPLQGTKTGAHFYFSAKKYMNSTYFFMFHRIQFATISL